MSDEAFSPISSDFQKISLAIMNGICIVYVADESATQNTVRKFEYIRSEVAWVLDLALAIPPTI